MDDPPRRLEADREQLNTWLLFPGGGDRSKPDKPILISLAETHLVPWKRTLRAPSRKRLTVATLSEWRGGRPSRRASQETIHAVD